MCSLCTQAITHLYHRQPKMLVSQFSCENSMLFLVVLCFIYFAAVEGGITDNRIVGGRLAKEGEFPYQVSLRRSYSYQHFCGGSLITPRHVLTAAHCMYYRWGGILQPAAVSVVAGQLQLNITDSSIVRNVSKIVIHADYQKTTMANDMAIIELDEEFPIDGHAIQIVGLRKEKAVSGSSCYVTGWGVLEYNSSEISNDLLAAEVYTVKFAKCHDMYGVLNVSLSEGMLCAGTEEGDKDACQGDSGGPLFCNGLLTGIVSTGQGCADPQFPGIYSDIPHFLQWIYENSGVDNITNTTAAPTTTTPQTNTNNTAPEKSPCYILLFMFLCLQISNWL